MATINCPLTGKVVNSESHENHISYSLTIAENIVDIFICRDCRRKISVNDQDRLIIEGLIANKKWPERCEIVSESCGRNHEIIDCETIVLQNYLQTAEYPKTPKDKLENLLLSLFKKQSYDGEIFELALLHNGFLLKNYFKNIKEGTFYIQGLKEQGLITSVKRNDSGAFMNIGITHKGLERTIELTENGESSKKCFIAMSFDPATKEIREAIRAALKETGYEAIIIDEQNVDSDRTINDEIIASLKKCKFCIADFSLHSNGVYFESGFALGQGKKVIYTCTKEEFQKAHFDIRPLQHIIHETPEELTKALINKIEAYIN